MAHYRVKAGGKTVWSKKIDGPVSVKNIPAEHRNNPDRGTVELYIDNELVGVQRPVGKD